MKNEKAYGNGVEGIDAMEDKVMITSLSDEPPDTRFECIMSRLCDEVLPSEPQTV